MKIIRCLLGLTLLPGMALGGCATPVGQGGGQAQSPGEAILADSRSDEEARALAPKPPDAGEPVDVDAMYKVLAAEFAARRGQLAFALDSYLEVARRTGDPRVAERAVRIAVYARDEARGLEAARLWAGAAQPNQEARQVYGALLVRAGRLEEATEVLSGLVAEVAPEDSGIFTRMADMLARDKSRTASVQVMQSLVEGYPNDVEAQFAFAQLLARFGEFDRAMSVAQAARALDSSSARLAVFQAQILQSQKKNAAAIDQLGSFLRDNPDANAARLAYARLLVDAKRYEDARAEFQRLAEAAPEDQDIAYALGLLLLQTNDMGESEVQFRKLIDDPGRRYTAWFYIGQIAESREDVQAALDAYHHVDRGEHHVNAQVRAATLMAGRGEIKEARQHLHALRGRNRQESVRIFRAEAEILTNREMMIEAMAVYGDALEEFPHDGGLLYARAMLAVRLERIDEAEADLREIISREPDNADALNALGYTLADRTERYDEAYEFIRRAYELKPDNHYVVDSLGWVLYRMGRLDEAIKHLRRALELKADAEVAAHLGEVLWVAGDREGAKDVWTTALKAQPEDKRLLDVLKRFGL